MPFTPSDIPTLDQIDIPALREKYRVEREKRLRKEGQAQYARPAGDVVPNYAEDPHKPIMPRDPVVEELDVAVLGAGFGGLLSSYHLMKQGVTNIRNIDTAGDFGGVWYWNRYPGIECDNDSLCYLPLLEETGFVPSRKFAGGSEIYGYCKHLAERYGFADKALFHTHVNSVEWDAASERWQIKTNRGDHLSARFVIVAAGVLNMPKLPSIPGIDSFKGKMFHSARWDYDYTGGGYHEPKLTKLADKTVAIVGTGATSIQLVPQLAKHAKRLLVIQRTPSTIDARPNPEFNPEEVKTWPKGWQRDRIANFHRGAMDGFIPGDTDIIGDIWTEINRNIAAHMEANDWAQMDMEDYMTLRETIDYGVMERLRARVDELVGDPDKAERLKAYYRYLCKRPLSSENYLQSFNLPNVELVDVAETRGVEAITEKGFMANGVEHDADCIIFASGFEVTSDLDRRWGIGTFTGRDGVSIYDHWCDGPTTFHGLMTHGFPNQFYIGYIQGGLNATVTEQFGEQGNEAAYIIAETLKRGASVVEPTAEAEAEYLRTFRELEIDMSQFQRECPPGYFNNEGEENPKWALFRGWGHGWAAFQAMIAEWRAKGDLAGLNIK